MIKKITYLIFFLFIFSIAKAEIIKEIIIEGNNRISDETIRVYGEIELNKNFTENEINKVLNNLYSTDFFENIEIQFKSNILNIKLKEYPVISQLIIIGEKKKAYKEELTKLIKLKEKKSFIKSYLNKDIEIIKKLYSSLGYNFVNVEAKVKRIDNNNIDLMIQIDRGE